jgi:hypothetical protein
MRCEPAQSAKSAGLLTGVPNFPSELVDIFCPQEVSTLIPTFLRDRKKKQPARSRRPFGPANLRGGLWPSRTV